MVLGSSAVAVIETPDSYVLEGRPDSPGLAYPGKLQFFGGHALVDEAGQAEEPQATIRRELMEELDFDPGELPKLVWAGSLPFSQDGNGNTGKREVALFYLPLESVEELDLQIPGEIVLIPKTKEAIEANRNRMTSFTFYVLMKAIKH